MKRVIIRNNQSQREPKPRVFDALIDENGKIFLETKVNKNQEIISLEDVIHQISMVIKQ